MEPISYIENDNSLVILLNKAMYDKEDIDKAIKFLSLQSKGASHIPYVSEEEQKEIEMLLEEPDSKVFTDVDIADL